MPEMRLKELAERMPDRLPVEELNWYRLDGWASGA